MWKSLVVMLGLAFCIVQSIDDNKIIHLCADKPYQAAKCLVVGYPNSYNDRVLVDKSYEKLMIPFFTRTDDLVLPDGGWSSYDLISFVEVSNPGDSGTVTMLRGGPGYRTVTLHLESSRGDGYNFHVLIKGGPAGSNFNALNATYASPDSGNSTLADFNAIAAPDSTNSTNP